MQIIDEQISWSFVKLSQFRKNFCKQKLSSPPRGEKTSSVNRNFQLKFFQIWKSLKVSPPPRKDCYTSVGILPVTPSRPHSEENFTLVLWLFSPHRVRWLSLLMFFNLFYHLVHGFKESFDSWLFSHKLLQNTNFEIYFYISSNQIPQKTSCHRSHGPWSWKTLQLLPWNQIVQLFLLQHAPLVSFKCRFASLKLWRRKNAF